MANPLTGDFEAVLQISGGTVNRLLATMHQNAHTNPSLPSFPHSVQMRMGDDHAFEGVRGLAHVQVAVPRVHLIHGATDRFLLEVAVRGWFRPDPGTAAMPAFIHGTVFAEYRVQDIDPTCRGWSKKAVDFLWIRVVRDSVRFEGTARDETVFTGILVSDAASDAAAAAAAAANVAKVTRQVARLLARRFEATPHPVSKRFRRGALRSLNTSVGGTAVALPIGISGEPMGDVNSINNVLLEGNDLAVGVNLAYIMSLTGPVLDVVKNFSMTVHVHISTGTYNPIPDFDTDYHIGMHPPTISWEPHGHYALFKVKVSGWANTNSIAPNASFDISLSIMLDFNAGDGRLHLTPWSPGVVVRSSGLGAGIVANAVKGGILKSIPPILHNACNSAQPALDVMTTRTQELSQQLRTLDANAVVRLDQGEFLADGIILRGTVDLTARHSIAIKTAKTQNEDAHTALECWIPGGRIDRFDWSWTWSGSGESGKAVFSDRFLLRRPRGSLGRWGIGDLKLPLPGLDGFGTVCLTVTGVQVDSVTGNFVTMTSTRRCTRFGFNISAVFANRERLFLRDMPELSTDVPFPQLHDLALVGMSRARDLPGAANTLLLYIGEHLDDVTVQTLAGALEACRRFDAGLAVLVLFREGLVQKGGSPLIAEIDRLRHKLAISLLVNEDVHAGWSRTLGFSAESGAPGWAIICPSGDRAWSHQGPVKSDVLANALDVYLRRSAQVSAIKMGTAIEVGKFVSARDLVTSRTHLADEIDEATEARCPPSPLGRLSMGETIVAFVQGRSAASVAHLRRLAGAQAEDSAQSPTIIAIFDGASQREVDSYKSELGLDIVAMADHDGSVSDRFGVGVWPTTFKLDKAGLVFDIQSGTKTQRDEELMKC